MAIHPAFYLMRMMQHKIDRENEERENEIGEDLDDLIVNENERNVENEANDEDDGNDELEDSVDELVNVWPREEQQKHDWQQAFNSAAMDRTIHLIQFHHGTSEERTSRKPVSKANKKKQPS